MLFTMLLPLGAAVAFLDTGIGLVFIGLSLAVAWMYLCVRRPLAAFLAILTVFVLGYSRLSLPLIDVAGPGDRGAIALGDLMWAGLVGTVGVKAVLSLGDVQIRTRYPWSFWTAAPFLVFAVALPLLGVLMWSWPLSYAIPGFRQLQWASFGFLACRMVRMEGSERVILGLFLVMALSGIMHACYGIIQLGYHVGLLGRDWVALDTFFVSQHKQTWFYYPRMTGLLVNPNACGMYGAILLLFVLALRVAGASGRCSTVWWSSLFAAVFCLVFSGSRTALCGLVAACFLCAVGIIVGQRAAKISKRVVLLSSVIISTTPLCLAGIWMVLPPVLQDRLTRFLDIVAVGVQGDINALARVEAWQQLWSLYWYKYPMGTLVPTSYATGMPVDSFYVMTAVQGTPLFTVLWLLFLFGLGFYGWSSYRKTDAPPLEAAGGFTLTAWAGFMAGAGLTLSPMLQPQLIAPFWAVVGALAARTGRGQRLG